MSQYPSRTDDIGIRAGPRSLLWGAIGGLVASILVGVPLALLGMMRDVPARLAGSTDPSVGWMVHLLAGAIVGLVYGLLVHTRDLRKGALYGTVFGLAAGTLLYWIAGNLLVGNAIPFNGQGMLQIGLHILWGLVLGLVAAWGLSRFAGAAGARRTAYKTV